MFFFDWISWLLNWFGLANLKANIAILGLGNAGKTTLLHRFSTERLSAHPPTLRPNSHSFSIGNVNFNAHDLGGQQNMRYLWRNYIPDNKTIIIFMVDSTDFNSIGESKSEIHDLLQDQNLENSHFLILGSKIDVKSHYSKEQLIQALDLQPYFYQNPQPKNINMVMISSVTKEGFAEMGKILRDTAESLNK
ncbi:hypothetical protein CYY_009076 [Polysphondylium violaceum]|uniref:Uncharacterized protein n=1 Tax=Polysphondylium violaceum TaxID=133409 RepID=A0A8J4PU84_9MYCE|nr:hypothetical protein CYY_009076 [Polysphondylium violaceum]